jgi:twitching motility two-component system response regulator PilH
MPRLLLVDDSPMMHRIVELTFAREDVQVIAVRDGEQALRSMSSTRPDVVLADHAAAGRSGYELAAFVKSHPDLAGVRVLLMGGAFEPVDELRAAQSGSDGVIVKPLEPRLLVERVRALLAPDPPTPRSAETGAPAPAPVQMEPRRADDGLDDYFDQLDVALGHLRSNQPPPHVPSSEPDEVREAHGGELEEAAIDGGQPAETAVDGGAPAEAAIDGGAPDEVGLPTVDALLARDRPTGVPAAEGLPEPLAIHGAPVATDDLVEQVTRRVLERLAPDAVDRVVREIVLEVAERHVREEVERIKTGDR